MVSSRIGHLNYLKSPWTMILMTKSRFLIKMRKADFNKSEVIGKQEEEVSKVLALESKFTQSGKMIVEIKRKRVLHLNDENIGYRIYNIYP